MLSIMSLNLRLSKPYCIIMREAASVLPDSRDAWLAFLWIYVIWALVRSNFDVIFSCRPCIIFLIIFDVLDYLPENISTL